jgi:hypothetical protein
LFPKTLNSVISVAHFLLGLAALKSPCNTLGAILPLWPL